MKSHNAIDMALALSTTLVCTLPSSSSAQMNGVLKPDKATQGKILQGYGKFPLSFEANQGQTDARVKFFSRGAGYTLFLTNEEAILSLHGKDEISPLSVLGSHLKPSTDHERQTTNTVLRMQILGANPKAAVSAVDELPVKSNYFIGNDPKEWRTNVANYTKVRYERMYPGVDLVYYGNQRQLEYDFVVAPGADPTCIRLKFGGAGTLRIDDTGDLVLGAAGEQARLQKPQVYQETSGTRKAVEGRYWMAGANTISFRVADYDRSKPLVIDPVLVYSTYLGGSGGDEGTGIAVDASGNAYVTGNTASIDFPTANALQPTFGGRSNAFVTKINPSGSALAYSTYLGGSNLDYGTGIAVDSSGNAYVTGYTGSTNFPTMNPLQPNNGGHGGNNAFVTKINPSGSALVYSTYLGGSGGARGSGIAVDSSGNAYVTGRAQSDFPTANALQPTNGVGVSGGYNAFVTKINPSGSALVYSTWLGGSTYDVGIGIAVDASGNAYVTGNTGSTDFPTISPIQSSLGGGSDAFVTKINPSGSALVYSTYLGGSNVDSPSGIAVDTSGNAYVTGYTESTDFPMVNALQPTLDGANNAFVTKINPSGSALVYSTYFAGGAAVTFGIAADASGNAYVTGNTASTDFPTANALQPTLDGANNAFVTKINPSGSALVYSTYLGGSNVDSGSAIAVDSSGNAYVTGNTSSTDFPTMNPLQPTRGPSGPNAFVTMIAPQTFASLITLVKEFDTKRDVAAVMVGTLELAQTAASKHAAKVADALLKVFSDEVSQQSGRSLTAAETALLIQYATALMM